jgi:hypothetical protein
MKKPINDSTLYNTIADAFRRNTNGEDTISPRLLEDRKDKVEKNTNVSKLRDCIGDSTESPKSHCLLARYY